MCTQPRVPGTTHFPAVQHLVVFFVHSRKSVSSEEVELQEQTHSMTQTRNTLFARLKFLTIPCLLQ